MSSVLLIVDPQNDFVLPDGALPVKGAVEDMQRLISFIESTSIDKIIVTMDSHMPVHIASPCYWSGANGQEPEPYAVISAKDVESGVWTANYDSKDAEVYLKCLESVGKQHIIWPPHTLYTTAGWEIYEPLNKVLQAWSEKTGREVKIYPKGLQSHKTEMFSSVMPEVSMDEEKDKLRAKWFLDMFDGFDSIYIAGEAENFCVKETVKSMAKMRPELISRLVILRSCMSLIEIPDDKTHLFWEELKSKGATINE